MKKKKNCINLSLVPAGFEDHEQEDLTSATSSLSLSPSYTSPEDSSEKKPVVQSYVKGVPEKFGTQTDKGKVSLIYFFSPFISPFLPLPSPFSSTLLSPSSPLI